MFEGVAREEKYFTGPVELNSLRRGVNSVGNLHRSIVVLNILDLSSLPLLDRILDVAEVSI